MRSLLRWCVAVALAVAAFEGLDLLGSTPGGGQIPVLSVVPTISPIAAGAVAAWAAGPGAVPSLIASVAAVWARIGADRAIGMLQGAHPPAEAGIVLILAFGVPWTVMALAGGSGVTLGRWVFRRRARRTATR